VKRWQTRRSDPGCCRAFRRDIAADVVVIVTDHRPLTTRCRDNSALVSYAQRDSKTKAGKARVVRWPLVGRQADVPVRAFRRTLALVKDLVASTACAQSRTLSFCITPVFRNSREHRRACVLRS